jgi:hypothetical protein
MIGLKRHEPSYKQLGLRANRTSVLCRNRTGHHNAELRTYRYMIGIKIHEHQYNTSYIMQTKLESCCTHCLLTCCLLPVHMYGWPLAPVAYRRAHVFLILSYIFTFLVQYCDVRYDFYIKLMYG